MKKKEEQGGSEVVRCQLDVVDLQGDGFRWVNR